MKLKSYLTYPVMFLNNTKRKPTFHKSWLSALDIDSSNYCNTYDIVKCESTILLSCTTISLKSQFKSSVLTLILLPLIRYSLFGKISSSVFAYKSIPDTFPVLLTSRFLT